jgi:hypothetical protein
MGEVVDIAAHTPKTIYISGPMRGIPRFNFGQFDLAADLWKGIGCRVVNPAARGWGQGDPVTGTGVSEQEVQDWLRIDIRDITFCDAIALLPGWEDSEGARLEAAVGYAIGLEFFHAITMEKMEVEMEGTG